MLLAQLSLSQLRLLFLGPPVVLILSSGHRQGEADASRGTLNPLSPSLHPERVHISTPNKYEFQYVQRPLCLTRFDVAVRAHNDARVALSAGPQDTAGMIEIVLGGHQNTRSWISTSKMGDPVASTHTAKILSWDEFRTFWISWHGGFIQAWPG